MHFLVNSSDFQNVFGFISITFVTTGALRTQCIPNTLTISFYEAIKTSLYILVACVRVCIKYSTSHRIRTRSYSGVIYG